MPLALCAVVERAMARDFSRRYSSATELMEALEPFLIAPSDVFESRPIPLVRRREEVFAPVVERDRLPLRWHPARWLAAAAIIAALVIALVPEWRDGISELTDTTFGPARASSPVVEPPQSPEKDLVPRLSIAPEAVPLGLPDELPPADETAAAAQTTEPAAPDAAQTTQAAQPPPTTAAPATTASNEPPRPRVRHRRRRPANVLPGVGYQPPAPRESTSFPYEPPPPQLQSAPEPAPETGRVVPFEDRDIWGNRIGGSAAPQEPAPQPPAPRPQPPVPDNPYDH